MFEHENLDRIQPKVLRHAFERSGLTTGELAANLGWIIPKSEKPDATRAKRVMERSHVSYELSVKFIEACHFDPVDYGL